jgi:soluble lytic murein transglycosylase-like protein
MTRFKAIFITVCSLGLIGAASAGTASASEGAYSSIVASHAAAHGLPPSLVHRVIMRESRYNARAVSKGNYGIMQIRLGTARAMGYRGSAAGLLDPNVNMTYAVKYLAGAYRAAGGNPDRAVALYASGYGSGRSSYVSGEARSAYASGRAYRGGRRGVTPMTGALAREVR